MDWLPLIVPASISGVIAAAVTWGAVKTELRFILRELDHQRGAIGRAHRRIDRIEERRHS